MRIRERVHSRHRVESVDSFREQAATTSIENYSAWKDDLVVELQVCVMSPNEELPE